MVPWQELKLTPSVGYLICLRYSWSTDSVLSPFYITQFSLNILHRVASSFLSRRCEGICGPPCLTLLSLPFGSVGAGAGPCVLELDPGCVPQLLGQAPLVL